MATDSTSRMAALLGSMRRERNGAVADAMAYYGKPYGLNYGVSLPTVRQIARTLPCDHDFARYLWLQDVRELRLAALWLADPARIAVAQSDFWTAGITTSELAEEAAFALLAAVEPFAELFDGWMAAGEVLPQYAVLLAAARREKIPTAQIGIAVKAVRRQAESSDARAARLTAQGAVALLAAAASQNEENRRAVIRTAGSLGTLPAEEFLREELAWRVEL